LLTVTLAADNLPVTVIPASKTRDDGSSNKFPVYYFAVTPGRFVIRENRRSKCYKYFNQANGEALLNALKNKHL